MDKSKKKTPKNPKQKQTRKTKNKYEMEKKYL